MSRLLVFLALGLHLLWGQRMPLPNLSTSLHESAPLPSVDGRRLFFWRLDDPVGLGAQDIFVAEWDDSSATYGPARPLSGGVNDPRGNIPLGITPNGQSLLVYKEFRNPRNACELGLSRRLGGDIWMAPVQLKVNNFHSESGSALTAFLGWDGRTLLLSMKSHGTLGGEDLYVSFYESEHKLWSAPLHLGSILNTPGDEITPYLAPDGVTLYFSSNGRADSKGFDIYLTRRLDDSWRRWSPPVRLPDGINSDADDFYFRMPALRPEVGFLVSSDHPEKGREIYQVPVPQAYRPRPVVTVTGQVRELHSQRPVGELEVRYYDLEKQQLVGTVYSDPQDGRYRVLLPAGYRYGIVAVGATYFSISEQIDLRGGMEAGDQVQDIQVVPLVTGGVIRLSGLYFGVGDSMLRPESLVELERLVWLMSEKPSLRIEVVGHTDSTGRPDLNDRLSLARAVAVVRYLEGRGIAPDRMKARGAGAREPVADNATPAGRAQNRRVEIRIVSL